MVGRSRGSGKFGDRVCDAPYQETGAQIALKSGDNGGVSVCRMWLRNILTHGQNAGWEADAGGERREGEGAGRRDESTNATLTATLYGRPSARAIVRVQKDDEEKRAQVLGCQ